MCYLCVEPLLITVEYGEKFDNSNDDCDSKVDQFTKTSHFRKLSKLPKVESFSEKSSSTNTVICGMRIKSFRYDMSLTKILKDSSIAKFV